MNALKLSSTRHAVPGPEHLSHCPVDREAQHPRAALVIAHDAKEQPARSPYTEPRSFRVAVKVGRKILFINLCDVVSVQAEGKCVWLQGNASSYRLRESISVVAEALQAHGFIRIHRSVLVNILLVQEIRPLSTGEYCLRVEGGKEYTVTRTYKKNLNSLADFWIGTGAFSPH